MKISGIYKIQSIIKPERSYIGSASSIDRRWKVHLMQLRKGIHHSVKMQRHYNKYGECDLMFTVLLGCDNNREYLLTTEQFFIDSHNPYFNTCKVAGSCFGRRQSDKMKRDMSNRLKGNKINNGRVASLITRQKMSESQKARHLLKNKERVLVIKEPRIRKPNIPPSRKGIKLTEDHKAKLRGRKISEETRIKLKGRTPWNKGKKNPYSKETIEKMSLANIKNNTKPPSRKGQVPWIKGKHHTEETKIKMRVPRKKAS